MKILFVGKSGLESLANDFLARWGFPVSQVDSLEQARARLESEAPPRLIVAEVTDRSHGVEEFCSHLRDADQERYIYLILAGVPAQKECMIKGVQAGADDFIQLPIEREDLEIRLRSAIRILDLVKEVGAMQELLRLRATHDALTGVRNRAAVLEELNRAIAHAKREARPVSILMADIDQLKTVNEKQGYPVGDRIIQSVVATLEQTLRPYDTLGRYGSDEFLLVVPGCNEDNAKNLAERIRKSVQSKLSESGPSGSPITLSIGYSTWNPGDVPEVQGLVQAADAAVYEAKRAGRNRTVQMTPRSQPVKKVG